MAAPDIEKKESAPSRDFIRTIIDEDNRTGKWGGRVHTRFPPEPNGYLHIGHAKSICLNFGIAKEFSGKCNLRFDDTNPSKEEVEYVDSIKEDVRWLGFSWDDRLFYASDYFEKLYQFAEHLITTGKAYVDDLSAEDIRAYRGTLTEPGKESPYRNRTPEENLDLFRRMRAGEFPDGARVLRAKIDMASPNIVLRDPTLYRIKHVHHHRTGEAWRIYPMYDYTHCISDALEGVTHSLCSLEFENNRPLYDWVLDNIPAPCHPQQIEFARLNLGYTVLSKRKLIQLVAEGHVSGWDDPRLPTLCGVRRRGYTPEALRDFCDRIGISKADNLVDMALLEHCLREDLNRRAKRVMAVLRPVKLVIENYPENSLEHIDFPYHPEDPAMGARPVPFTRELFVERDDFCEEAPKKWYRLAPGAEVRLRHAYYVTCTGFDKDPETGEITAIHCVHDPATKGGWSSDGRKVRGTLHWVSAAHALPAEVRLYDRLFTKECPAEGPQDFKTFLNPNSLEIVPTAMIEPSLASAKPGDVFQFERLGYFRMDRDSTPSKPVFNRSVALKDSWAKIAKK
ncbi:glutamine--tRNA ligase/YqeY domain fusion protein [Desulfolutivibrio sulfoxidireducens]|uniref:glutamine--tRNA ligase/YqeY domain fusion protein n=1 Tax=Desulfolutivibrio sulfoxidireducens TaxID=2773299 RepID=UPI00159E44ED|nr:glutamine--tRNA ligase/YqeY domain fusion protein [Desulfolutivibrio sulfoxidireducens]QLA18453.1 glutamine--tRNA ligase/YqeY domain fusion protein [Desulfolutivibrio sulfoxidireducens]